MIKRLWRVYRIVTEQRLDTLLPPAQTPLWVLGLVGFNPKAPKHPETSRGVRLREAFEQLGPVFIKFGQLLSTRRDLLPDDIADELALLQDQVPPIPSSLAVSEIEGALGACVDVLFEHFERAPLAAASLAQVHGAQLHTGESVVVKVLRPDIRPVIEADLGILTWVAKWLPRLFPDAKRLRPGEVVADYRRALLHELDLRREAGNASQIRRAFLDSGLVYVPEVHWPLTTQTTLVSERIYGIPVTDIERLNALGVDLKKLAERGVEIFFTQVFRDSFFHADMHPGNIFVDATDPQNPSYIAVDCAIVGQLDQTDLYYLARNLLAIFRQDYRQVAKLHIECGWVPPTTPVAEFEAAIRTLCEPIFERPLGEISFGHMLVSLFRTAGEFNMEVQPQLVLLQKTLLNIEGLGRQLYPQLNLWDTAQPFLERWLKERYAPQNVLKQLQAEAPAWLEILPTLPDLVLARLRQPSSPPEAITHNRHKTFALLCIAGGAAILLTISLLPIVDPLWLAGGCASLGIGVGALLR